MGLAPKIGQPFPHGRFEGEVENVFGPGVANILAIAESLREPLLCNRDGD
jgi:hypothetical protein